MGHNRLRHQRWGRDAIVVLLANEMTGVNMADFKKDYTNVHAYYEQWLKTATKGNVEADFAYTLARMRLTCKVCQEQLIVPEPEGAEVSYGVQEFVKIHAHTGGHNDGRIQTKTFSLLNFTATQTGVLKYKDNYKTLQGWANNAPAVDVPIKKKDKPLKSWTGRKFR